jgi:hypothetical protein
MQAFAPDEAGAQSVSSAALCMAAVSLTSTVPVSFVIHHFGRVKVLLPVVVVMPTVLVCLIVDEQWSHESAFYYATACALAFCDSCLHVTLTGE